jgi:hypothetical protein
VGAQEGEPDEFDEVEEDDTRNTKGADEYALESSAEQIRRKHAKSMG